MSNINQGNPCEAPHIGLNLLEENFPKIEKWLIHLFKIKNHWSLAIFIYNVKIFKEQCRFYVIIFLHTIFLDTIKDFIHSNVLSCRQRVPSRYQLIQCNKQQTKVVSKNVLAWKKPAGNVLIYET